MITQILSTDWHRVALCTKPMHNNAVHRFCKAVGSVRANLRLQTFGCKHLVCKQAKLCVQNQKFCNPNKSANAFVKPTLRHRLRKPSVTPEGFSVTALFNLVFCLEKQSFSRSRNSRISGLTIVEALLNTKQ